MQQLCLRLGENEPNSRDLELEVWPRHSARHLGINPAITVLPNLISALHINESGRRHPKKSFYTETQLQQK
jgi:hypothetical protein